ncbi:MAG: NUDIX domain-containing protein [Patescibacteria group bacterium]|nr:NUDIX domain-containing protein [Patescibacteria group bacterium]
MKFEFSAGGIVYKKEGEEIKFALICDSFDKWTFPKGKIEKKEKPEIAALREIEEEIGISNLKIIESLGKIDYWFRKDDLIHKFVYFYLVEAPPEAVLKHQVEEISDAEWFDFNKAIEILGYKKDDLPLLKKAFTILNGGVLDGGQAICLF